MLDQNDPTTQLIKKGAEAARDLNSFYEVHGEDLTSQLEGRAQAKEKAIVEIANQVIAARPGESADQIGEEISQFGAQAGPAGSGYLLFAAMLKRVALGERVGRFS